MRWLLAHRSRAEHYMLLYAGLMQQSALNYTLLILFILAHTHTNEHEDARCTRTAHLTVCLYGFSLCVCVLCIQACVVSRINQLAVHFAYTHIIVRTHTRRLIRLPHKSSPKCREVPTTAIFIVDVMQFTCTRITRPSACVCACVWGFARICAAEMDTSARRVNRDKLREQQTAGRRRSHIRITRVCLYGFGWPLQKRVQHKRTTKRRRCKVY